MKKFSIKIYLGAIFMIGIFGWGCFDAGVRHSRGQIAAIADDLAKHNTNSFTKCLTESWELSGELDPAWKGKRGWKLEPLH
jgi:hypothetical protein